MSLDFIDRMNLNLLKKSEPVCVLFQSLIVYISSCRTSLPLRGVIINSRPITYIYDDEVEDVLTPAHFILGRRLLSKFDVSEEVQGEDNPILLTRRMKYLKSLSDLYWKRFKDEYLLELRSRHIQGKNPKRTPEIGEIVVIEGKAKHNMWRLGKIVRKRACCGVKIIRWGYYSVLKTTNRKITSNRSEIYCHSYRKRNGRFRKFKF